MPDHLVDRRPHLNQDELVAAMVPPGRFGDVRFETYRPDPDEPSQTAAVEAAQAFARQINEQQTGKRGLFGRKAKTVTGAGLYFDGGFGVGKTHLLASLWHEVPSPKTFGTFVELTHLVGALGFAATVERLSTHRLLAIDEFELDDPGDTMVITRLLAELSAAGVNVAATSNTLPGQLGEGRFAAQDFLREIKTMSDRFTVLRVDGPDYRHRDLPPAPDPVSEEELVAAAEAIPGATLDSFDDLCAHLATLHPSRYGALVRDLPAVHLSGVHAAADQAMALRLVVFADRLYDADIPVTVSGAPLDKIFTEEMLNGGYRKKYLRATSRLVALSRLEAAV
ncbi:cell division protein ZapE [Rhodococcus sp. X156]|uniref:cell division protein ZapE n=1 Tax=Rhodococcus sp. X156 TaxID=2499145 RepID=UPI000FD77298|nr:cell division protein ZapE [Rhodococcus sp. X156]